VVGFGKLGVGQRRRLRVAAAHALREALDALGVVAFDAEVLARDVPIGSLPSTRGLDVGGLLARLPAAGHDERPGDGGSLSAVDVRRIGKPQAPKVISCQCSPSAGDVELDRHLAGRRHLEDFATLAVLDALDAPLVVLFDERYAVALADAVVDAGNLHIEL